MERRSARRLDKRLLARIHCNDHSCLSFVRNVSDEGLLLVTREICPPGSTIRIEIEGLLNRLRLIGRVVWSRRIPPHLFPAFGGAMGVRLAEAARTEMKTLLRAGTS